MHRNGISTEYFQIRNNERAALSLAYLDSNGDADYTFYKEEPLAATDYSMPEFTEKDYFLFGSYYSICPGLRPQVKDILENAHDAGTVIYYDINFRRSHSHQKQALLPVIQENCRLSSIVRGSADDFDILFGTRDPEEIYRKHISPFCPIFICTAGAGHIFIYTPTEAHDFIVPQIPAEEIVSTVGAGDSFNAGFLCAMYHRSIRKDQVLRLSYSQWEELISNGILYSSQVCRSQHNYINGNLRASEFCV
jgi:fructokinase